jgi:hypothetical protein
MKPQIRLLAPLFLLLIGIFLVKLIVVYEVLAVTPPIPPGVAKPSDFIITLPWVVNRAVSLGAWDYGNEGDHSGEDLHALDFFVQQGSGGAAGHESDIRAIAAGTVVWSGWWSPQGSSTWKCYGNSVAIAHEGAGLSYVSFYTHLDSITAAASQEGNYINRGDVIGTEGNTGSGLLGCLTFGTHLHFVIYKDANSGTLQNPHPPDGGTPVVPEPFVGKDIYEGFGLEWIGHGGWKGPLESTDLSADAVPGPPGGQWGNGATGDGATIEPDQPVMFQVVGLPSDTKEIRFTTYYPNWSKMIDAHDSAVWRILARCWPDREQSECEWGNNHTALLYRWFPHSDNLQSGAPWLPSGSGFVNHPYIPDETRTICFSFDIFDLAGNVTYAPAGTQCTELSTLHQDSLEISAQNISGGNAARLIYIQPPTTAIGDAADFVADITIPDGTIVSPGQALVKTWRLGNAGTSSWDSNYELVFVGGEQMSAPSAVNVANTTPGQEADISVNLTAPSSSGQHIGYWRLRNPQGTFFGPTIWIKINVQSGSSYITVLAADPPSPADTNSVHIHARVENFPNFRAMRLKIDGEVVYELGAPEFYYDWNTGGYATGDHSIVVEVADWSDLSWSHPEVRSMTYTLTGTGAPNNHAPYRPTPTAPYDWYVYYSGNTAQLCAQDSGDPDGDTITGYYFDIYESAQLWNSGWVGGPCVTTSALGPYGYKWRVKVRDSYNAESEWSDSWHFTLVNPELTITELYFEPLDGNSEQVRVRACTDGQGGIGITMRVSVNDANDGSGNGTWHTFYELGVPCFNQIDAPIWHTLDYGDGSHRVRVEAHGLATGWDGAAVREEVYTLPHRRPASAHLVAPVPFSGNIAEPIYLNSPVADFLWDAALRANNFTLHISDMPNPQSDPTPIYRQSFGPTVLSQTVTFSASHPVLYWQIETTNDVGSNLSGAQRFGIDTNSPSCTIVPPAAVSYETVFQVTWNGNDSLSGIRAFDIQYKDSDRNEWNDWMTHVPFAQTYELFTGQAGHQYTFRCRAIDNAGNLSNYSGPSTPVLIDPTARPVEPWWNTNYLYKRSILVLNNMPSTSLPAGYAVHLRFDSSTTPTAAEIYQASASPIKCDDLRVVYNHSIELARHIQFCELNQIELWFKTQVVIDPGTTDSDSYRLYYGSADANNPPADQTEVWSPMLDANTVGLWFLTEGAGSTVADLSGYGNHGNRGILTWVHEKFGYALASPDHTPAAGLTIPSHPSMGSSAFTLEFFAKRLDTGGGYIAGMGLSGNDRERMRLKVEGMGTIAFQIDPPEPGGASDIRAETGCLQDLEWHHVAVTFDGFETGQIYCDGVLRGSGQFNDPGISNLDFTLFLGSDFSTETRFHGVIDQVRLSNMVRTSFPYAQFTAITNEPTLAANSLIPPPVTGSADLVILGLHAYPNPNGGVLIEAVVQNQGNVETQNGFYTDVYLDHIPTGAGDYTGSIQFWVNDSIEAGATVTMTTLVNELLGAGLLENSSPNSEVSGTLYAQADSTGVISEPNNTNNIYNTGTEVCMASADEYEDDNAWYTATPLAIDTTQRHNIHSQGDEDWFVIQVTEIQTYTIRTFDLGDSADTYLYLYASDGSTLLVSNDDSNGTLASRIDWKPSAAGTYYVMVKHWNPNVSGCGTSYSIGLGERKLFLPLIVR